jgi:hypothetical protein
MAITITHPFVSPVVDEGNPNEVGPNEWNAAHTVTGAVADTIQVIAGAGLTGGGALSANRTLDVGAGTGITVNANDVALDTSSTRNTDHASVTLTAGAGLTGGGDISANRTFAVGAGTGITVNADDVALDTSHVRNAAHPASSTDNAVARYDGTAGALQDSGIVVDDSGRLGAGLSAPDSLIHVAAQANAQTAIANTLVHLTGANATVLNILMDGHGAGAVPQFIGRRSAGTAASPSAISSGQTFFALQGFGYGSTGYSAGFRAQFNMFASETWTDAAQGCSLIIQNTLTGTTTSNILIFGSGNGGICIGAQTNPGATGNLLCTASIKSNSATDGIGYATGAGGTVTQTTSRTTGVTLNKVCGQITTDTTSLAAGATAKFTVTNSAVATTDVVSASIDSGTTTDQTDVKVQAVGAGSFDIVVANRHASTAETGAIVINFAVQKVVTS